MQQVVSDMNMFKRLLFLNLVLNVTVSDWNHRDCLAGDELEQVL
jgi:hypothetical protein